ncbi:MAG: galactokinase family protein [Rhodothermales bacterium]
MMLDALTEPRLQDLKAHLAALPGESTVRVMYVPGRIELLGKHTDYAGGVSLTCASSRRMVAILAETRDAGITFIDAVTGERERIAFDGSAVVKGWASYADVAVRRVVERFGKPKRGATVVFMSDIPKAAGMSSSSVVTTMAVLAALSLNGDGPQEGVQTLGELATFLGEVESGVGTRGGSQDHTAILMGKDGKASLFGYHPVERLLELDWPSDMHLVIGVSGVKASKRTGAKELYNAASALARRIGEAWADDGMPSLMGAILEHGDIDESRVIEMIDAIAGSPEDRTRLWHRFAQFHDECTVVIPDAVQAWRAGDWDTFGDRVAYSQQMAEEWLGNQVPETSWLVRSAREHGAVAASAFGAGYGGAVWAMVPVDRSAAMMEQWSAAYGRAFPDRTGKALFFRDRPSEGVRVEGGATWPE